jgi:hypothetical protein
MGSKLPTPIAYHGLGNRIKLGHLRQRHEVGWICRIVS